MIIWQSTEISSLTIMFFFQSMSAGQADALRRQKDAELRRDTVEAMMLEEIVIEEPLSCAKLKCWLLLVAGHLKNLRRMFINMLKNGKDFYKISIIAIYDCNLIAIILSTCCLILLLLNVLGLYTLPLSSIESHSCIFNILQPANSGRDLAIATALPQSLCGAGFPVRGILDTTQFFEDHSLSTPQICNP